MKKIVSLVLMLAFCMSFVTGCGNDSILNNGNSASTENESAKTEKIDITIGALKGPTSIGMVQIMENSKNGTALNDYKFSIAGTADEFTADLIKGDVQIAAIPSNLAANLYNKSGGKVKIIGINTLGVLYNLQTGDSIKTIQDLKGKTIYTTGKGTTPEFT